MVGGTNKNAVPHPWNCVSLVNGRGERIRTSGLSVPNAALYQAEPRPDKQ